MTTETRIALTDRGAFSLPEAACYAHVNEDAARELCNLGVVEMREHGSVERGWECFVIGRRGQWRIVRASVDRWLHEKAIDYARRAERPQLTGPVR